MTYQTQNPNPTPESELLKYDYFSMPREMMMMSGQEYHEIRPETLQLDALRRSRDIPDSPTLLPDMNQFIMHTEDGRIFLHVPSYEQALKPSQTAGALQDSQHYGLLREF